MTIIFDIVFIIFAILYVPYVLINGKWHNGFLVRLGLVPVIQDGQIKKEKRMWFHAVSVGEVSVVLELIKRAKQQFPGYQIILSTVTQTGNRLALSKLENDDIVIYAPLDFSLIVRKYIDLIMPDIYITAETEIWPNLFLALSKRNIPVVQVNGRVSDGAYRWYKRAVFLFRPVLEKVSGFCMQTKADADKIISLGALKDKVNITGNMKFDKLQDTIPYQPADLGFNGDELFLIAGSTHRGEEEILLHVFQDLRSEFPELRLIIAPRHIERLEEVENIVKECSLMPILFSQRGSVPMTQSSVIVVDEIGHLQSIFSFATVVFMGKSLTAKGGQNIIEPAFFGKPILIGPNMQNFENVVELFLKEKAIIQIRSQEELTKEIRALILDADKRTLIGEQAKKVVRESQGATARTQEIISNLLMPSV